MFRTVILMTNFLHMKCMDLTYEVIGDQNVDPITHNWTKDIQLQGQKLTLIPILNSSSMMTPSFLTTFKLLIFTLFNLSLLISILLAREMFEILKVVQKQNAIVAMHLDWLCSISNLLLGFSPSLIDGLERCTRLKCKKYKFMKIR